MEKVNIVGLKVDSITKQNFLDSVLTRIKTGQKTFVITPYSEFLYYGFRDPKLLEIFNAADFALADGIGIFWAKKYLSIPLTAKTYWGKILQAAWQIKYSLAAIIFYPSWIKSAFPEKIVGADLVWDLAKLAADNNFSIYFLGGFGNTPELAAKELSGYASKTCGRTLNQHWSNKNPGDSSVIADINLTAPDFIFVAYGPVKQEKWIYENLPKLNVKLAIGVGGSFDYIAGVKSAPPKFVRYSGLEWLWRLFTQPARYKRIFNATFGLMSGLWHYKVFVNLPMRPNVAVIIINNSGKILVCQTHPKNFYVDIISTPETLKNNYWQFPQGGIDGKEDIETAAKREAMEEAGVVNLRLIKISEKTNMYFWNNSLRTFSRNRKYQNKGQIQRVAYFKFSDGDDQIKIDNKEFIKYRWVKVEDLSEIIHPERVNLTGIVIEDLKEMAEKAII